MARAASSQTQIIDNVMDSCDPLTGLGRYEAFSARLEALLNKASGCKSPGSLALGLVDIDWFGRINKELGRETGDAILREVAGEMTKIFAPDRGEVFRFGGDALAVLLPGGAKEDAFLKLENFRQAIGSGRKIADAEIELSVSAGVAAWPDDGADPRQIERRLNEAIYRAKVGGRNRVCLAREEKMTTKTCHYTQGQLQGLTRLAKREGFSEAELLREGLDDLLRKYNA